MPLGSIAKMEDGAMGVIGGTVFPPINEAIRRTILSS
jgi:hypothetical protein